MDVLLDTCGRRRVRCLLLLCLVVVKAAADCAKPQPMGNIVLTDKALLMNDFLDGSSVTLECANGYVKDSGSAFITCIAGTWTEQELTCKKKDCGPPKPQPHMNFDTSSGTLFGAVIRVVCDEGYQVSGSSYKQCYATGWSGRAKCEIVTCDKPGVVTNSRSFWDPQDTPKYGDVVQYLCDEGHTLIGKDSITCTKSGEYDSPPPECKGVMAEDRVPTEMLTPTSTPPAQEESTATGSSATATAHREKTITTSATPTVSPSVRGFRDILPIGETTSAASTTSSSLQDKHDVAVDTTKDNGYAPGIIAVTCVGLAVCIIGIILYKFLLKRKGSYDTREDLKPELLQFQNL